MDAKETSSILDTKETIRHFVLDHIPAYDLKDDDDFFALGLVSSMFVMQLVLFVEQSFGLTIDGADLNFDYFRSVNAVTDLVERKLEG